MYASAQSKEANGEEWGGWMGLVCGVIIRWGYRGGTEERANERRRGRGKKEAEEDKTFHSEWMLTDSVGL